jgi:hypothetical protein
MNISYIDMWPGFDSNSNWFNLLFRDLLNDKEINFNSTPEEADLILGATFGNTIETIKNNKAVKIFYTGENKPPDLLNYHYSLSFDFHDYGGKNFRLPHWYLYINWWNEPNFSHAEIKRSDLSHQWDVDELWNRQYFCSIVIGNPVQNRLEVANKLNEYKAVHGFGAVFNNSFAGSKIELLKNFKYNICFENTSSNGYITEKLLEAKVAGCLPIYYGHKSVAKDFNENCVINYLNFRDAESVAYHIKKIDTNKDLFAEFVSRPLFNVQPNLDTLYVFLKKIIGDNQ